VFLTNHFTLSADIICALYKARRQVELFFKWITQHLPSGHAVLRYVGTWGDVANLDRRLGLCPRRHRQEAHQSGCVALHVATDFFGRPVREAALAASVTGLRPQNRTGPQRQPTESIHALTRLYREILLMRGPVDFRFFRNDHMLFTLVVATFLIYAGLFIYRTSFVIDGERYFSLFDDAMIAMRYARNFANGYGLVWNPGGERVEGYTDPLWVLFMSLIHLLPISQSKTSLFVQLTSAVLLAVNLFFVRKIALSVSDGSESVALGAVILTASYLPINNWSLQGMEVSVLVLIMSMCLWQAIQCMSEKTFRIWPYLLLGASTWVRPDMVVPLGGLMLFLAVADPFNRRRHLVWGSVMLVIFCAAQTAFRLWYFGDILPNTYYLKLIGYPFALRISQGIYVLVQFMWKLNVLLFVLPFMLAVRRDRRILVLLWALIAQMMYSVYVGGDAWEYWGGSNRYISIAMPGFFILLSYALFRVSQFIVGAMNAEPRAAGIATTNWKGYIFPLLIAYSVITVNSIYGLEALAEVLLIKPPLHTGNGEENHEEVEQALLLRKITTTEAKIAVARAGTIPYFSDRYSIDEFGKANKYIAHQNMKSFAAGWHRLIEFRPGHMKFDYGYSIGQQQPDVVAQLGPHGEEARPYLQIDYRGVRLRGKCIYVREGSVNVLWENVSTEVCH
jgi:arabinofuranosyltransferase